MTGYKYTVFETPFCEVTLVSDFVGLVKIHLQDNGGKDAFEIDDFWDRDDHFFSEHRKQILEYFDGKRRSFELPLHMKGTDFQIRVWNSLALIPFGQTRTYKEIATQIGNSKASRAIGMANGKNPLPLVIPCHRVIGSSGKLTGFAFGLSLKKKLLDFEKSVV